MATTPVPTVAGPIEWQLGQLLGGTAVDSLDSFIVQEVLDQDSILSLPLSNDRGDVAAWRAHQADRLPPSVRQRLETAAGLLRTLELRNPGRKAKIVERYRQQLENSKTEMSAELNKKAARTARQFHVSWVWPVRGTDYTYFFADVRHIRLTLSNGRQWIPLSEHPTSEEEDRYEQLRRAGFTVAWQRAEPIALYLMRLDWRMSRISDALPAPKISGLERALGTVKTISEIILLAIGVWDALLLARLTWLATGAGMRTLAARILRATALRRAMQESAHRAEALGARAITSASRGTYDATSLSARGLAERGVTSHTMTPAARGLTEGGPTAIDSVTKAAVSEATPVARSTASSETVFLDTTIIDALRRGTPGIESELLAARARGVDFAIPRAAYSEALRGKSGEAARTVIERLGLRIDEGLGISSRISSYQQAIERGIRFEGLFADAPKLMGDLVIGAHAKATGPALWTLDKRSIPALKQLGVDLWSPF